MSKALKNILVIGGSGFIGSHTQMLLAKMDTKSLF